MEWPLLSTLGDDERERLLAAARRRRFTRNEVLVHEGDPSDSLHLVAAGRLAVRVSTAAGAQATINVLGPGDWFGEVSLLNGTPPVRSATVLALEPAETLTLTALTFRGLRSRHPGVEELVTTLLARRVEELSARLLEALYDGLDRRVHRRLVELARLYAEPGAPAASVVVPLTQERLAELVGGTRPSVNLVLQRLAAERLVRLGRGQITVTDPAALARTLV